MATDPAKVLVLALGLGLWATDPAGAAEDLVLTGPAQVRDGDTLDLGGETVRLFAIDAPEAGQSCTDETGRTWPCGREATRALRRLATGDVRCEGRGRDRYGRVVATCFVRGTDLAHALVRSGAAFAYPRYGLDYVDAEKAAMIEGRGVWRGVWRGGARRPDMHRAQSATRVRAVSGPAGCPIKGNISSNGRIYHVPGQAHYAKTRISEARGERWFCSEAEAQAAGWRRARR